MIQESPRGNQLIEKVMRVLKAGNLMFPENSRNSSSI